MWACKVGQTGRMRSRNVLTVLVGLVAFWMAAALGIRAALAFLAVLVVGVLASELVARFR